MSWVRERNLYRHRYEVQRDWVKTGVYAVLYTLMAVVLTAFVLGSVIALVSLGISTHTRAHQAPSGWEYPLDCCHEHDCRMLPASRVKAMADGGYLIDGLIAIQRERVRPSPDGEYHACMPTAIHVRCFWAPRPSS